MNICQVSAELAPWSKTGGLGDVCGALPRALAARGHRVMTVAPRYKDYPDTWDTGLRRHVHLHGALHELRYFHAVVERVHHVFVDHPSFRRPGIYGDSRGAYGDNLFRFSLLCRAALDAALVLPLDGAPLGEDTVFHCNDWHTALLPLFMQAVYRPAHRYGGARTVLAIHNAAHHGNFSLDELHSIDVPPRWRNAMDYGGHLNCLKTGLVLADRLLTVSPGYARELLRDQAFGLEELLRQRREDLFGILNGIGEDWDPSTDPHLPHRYSAEDLAGKAQNKAALQAELGLPQRADLPLLSFIARLDAQKGVSLLLSILPWIAHQGAQIAILGSGNKQWEQELRDLAAAFPRQIAVKIGFDNPLAHRIEAGADIFLMPSVFEPCGLNQMYSMRYGTVPIVHAVGGLADTVETVDPSRDRGTGWAFHSFTAEAFTEAIGWALYTWKNHPTAWRALQLRGMERDWGWQRAAALYEKVYASTRPGE